MVYIIPNLVFWFSVKTLSFFFSPGTGSQIRLADFSLPLLPSGSHTVTASVQPERYRASDTRAGSYLQNYPLPGFP